MKKMITWLKDRLPTKRRWMQLYAALLFNAHLKGFGNGQIYKGPLKNICTPGLNCYSCPGAATACPLGALQNSLSASGHTLPFYVFGVIALYGLLFGRWICGFLCPFGLIQELLHKIPTPKLKKNKVTRVLSYFKYVILAVFVFLIPVLYLFRDFPLPGFCKYICPAGTLEGAMGLLSNKVNDSMFAMLGPLFTWKFLLMVSILVACVFIFRMFCRFLCPLGALYGFFNKFALVGIKLDQDKCTDCGLCVSKCQMDIRRVADHECINCGECVSVCPTKAIQWKGSKWVLPDNDITPAEDLSPEEKEREQRMIDERNQNIQKRARIIKIVVGVLMIALLAGTLIYCNISTENPKPSVPPVDTQEATDNPDETAAPDAPKKPLKGINEGNECYGMTLPYILEDDSFTISEGRGKITVLNFWGTWCGPCKAELPHFDQIATEYKDVARVVTIHSVYAQEDPESYIQKNFPASEMLFTRDENDAFYYLLFPNGAAWPQTAVLDEQGVIIYKRSGKMEYAELKAVLDTITAYGTPDTGKDYNALIAAVKTAVEEARQSAE